MSENVKKVAEEKLAWKNGIQVTYQNENNSKLMYWQKILRNRNFQQLKKSSGIHPTLNLIKVQNLKVIIEINAKIFFWII